jgi:hypothetical protein
LLEQGSNDWQYPTIDELLDARQGLDDLSDQFGWLVKRHLLGGEEIHVHIRVSGGDVQREKYVGCVSFIPFRWATANGPVQILKEWLPTCIYELDRCSPRDQIQAPVLVPVVEFVEGLERVPERIGRWYAIERLQLLERCSGLRGSVLELSSDLVGGVPPVVDVGPCDISEWRAVDRKLISLVLLLASASDECRDEVVETGSHVVGEVPDEELPFGIEAIRRKAELVLGAVRLQLTLDGVQLLASDSLKANTEDVEVCLRPPPLAFVVSQQIHGVTSL